MQFRSIAESETAFESGRQKGRLSFYQLRDLYIHRKLPISEVGRRDGISRQASFVRYYRFFVLNGCHYVTGRERERLALQRKQEIKREQNLEKIKKVRIVVSAMEERGYRIEAFYARPNVVRFMINGYRCGSLFSKIRFFSGLPYFHYDFRPALLKDVRFVVFIGEENDFRHVFIVPLKTVIRVYGNQERCHLYIPVNGRPRKKTKLNFWRYCDDSRKHMLRN